MNQRKKLKKQLKENSLKCMICCKKIRSFDPIYSCSSCYNIFHLKKCITKWANLYFETFETENWLCPACYEVEYINTTDYYCFCRKTKNTRRKNRFARSCGLICGRKCERENHKCPLICHPGPCDLCEKDVVRSCFCGKTLWGMPCFMKEKIQHSCQEICNKELDCSHHRCSKKCHKGSCDPCYKKCEKLLNCNRHRCYKECHKGPCEPCYFICDKILNCSKHRCSWRCHEDLCDVCPRTCRRPMACHHLYCYKNCHNGPCGNCSEICLKLLNCSSHTCMRVCHTGPCDACLLSDEYHTIRMKIKYFNVFATSLIVYFAYWLLIKK